MKLNSISHIGNFLSYLIIFLLSPLLSIVAYLIGLHQLNNPNKYQCYGLYALLSLWLGGMNATKTPASDQIAYEWMYNQVPRFNFFEALTMLNTDISQVSTESYLEPVYKAFCYLGYYLTFGNSYWYFSFVTFVIYIFSFYCIHRLLTYAGYNWRTIITGVFICAFFFQFFNETAHAIRQFLSSIIILLSIIKKNETQKNPWLLYIIALLTHKSTILFVLFCMIPYKIIDNKKNLIVSLLLISICTLFMSSLSSSLMFLFGSDSYILNRASVDSQEFSEMNKLILYSVVLPIIFICLRGLLTNNIETYKIRFFLYISLLLCVFVISCGKNTLFQGRYFFYLYCIVPFCLPLLYKKGSLMSKYYQLTLCIFMPVYFFSSFKTCIWQYADTVLLLFAPYPCLLNYF